MWWIPQLYCSQNYNSQKQTQKFWIVWKIHLRNQNKKRLQFWICVNFSFVILFSLLILFFIWKETNFWIVKRNLKIISLIIIHKIIHIWIIFFQISLFWIWVPEFFCFVFLFFSNSIKMKQREPKSGMQFVQIIWSMFWKRIRKHWKR